MPSIDDYVTEDDEWVCSWLEAILLTWKTNAINGLEGHTFDELDKITVRFVEDLTDGERVAGFGFLLQLAAHAVEQVGKGF
jgi:hypothetical protein